MGTHGASVTHTIKHMFLSQSVYNLILSGVVYFDEAGVSLVSSLGAPAHIHEPFWKMLEWNRNVTSHQE